MDFIYNKGNTSEMENYGSDVPIDIENPHITLETSIQRKLESLSPLSSKRCIYRVPHRLCDMNSKAYTPKVVSIGPFHHGNESLKPMEEHKRRYLQAYLKRTDKSLGSYIKIIKEKEAELRSCYAEPIDFTSDRFTEIVLVDAAFIIEMMLRSMLYVRPENDHIFGRPWLMQDINLDLQMLENQLPFFILEDLFDAEKIPYLSDVRERPSIKMLCCEFCRETRKFEGMEENLDQICSYEIEHFVDLLRTLYVPLNPKVGGLKHVTIPNTTELHQAGVAFKVASSKNLFGIAFSEGILELPKLTLYSDATEVIFKNLLAFEQCHCKKKFWNDYVTIMDSLVNTAKDVDLLVKRKILVNNLEDSSKAATLINELGDRAIFYEDDFYFADVYEKLDDYCKVPWNTWKANLKQSHFSNPWAIVSLIAAGILLILTVTQTVCSIISVT